VFKQYYTYFYTLFTHTYIKKIQTTLLEQHYQTGPKFVRDQLMVCNKGFDN